MDDATAAVRGAERTGPVNSSGTKNTIRATRMTAPVSRSFTWITDSGGENQEAKRSAAGLSACWLVYPKPLQRRPDRIHRAADDDAVAGLCLGARQLAACGYRGGELDGSSRGRNSLRELRRRQAARTGQRTHDPVIHELRQRGADTGGVLIGKHADHGDGPSLAARAHLRQRPLA